MIGKTSYSRIKTFNIVKMALLWIALRIQWNSYQNPNGIFYKNRKPNPKIHMEPQRNLNSQNNLEKEEQSWRNHASSFQNLVKNYSNENSVVMAYR